MFPNKDICLKSIKIRSTKHHFIVERKPYKLYKYSSYLHVIPHRIYADVYNWNEDWKEELKDAMLSSTIINSFKIVLFHSLLC